MWLGYEAHAVINSHYPYLSTVRYYMYLNETSHRRLVVESYLPIRSYLHISTKNQFCAIIDIVAMHLFLVFELLTMNMYIRARQRVWLPVSRDGKTGTYLSFK